MTVHICAVGKLRESYFREAAAEYEKRISPYAKVVVTELDDIPDTAKTAAKLLAAVPARCYKIALCVEGKPLSSEELSACIEQTALNGYSDIAFFIGGADGLDDSVKKACDLRLSFSKMTFPHRLMRVILLEQIYRAFNIAGGGKYHH